MSELIDDDSFGIDPEGAEHMDVRSNALDDVRRRRPPSMFERGEMAERSKALDWNSSNIFTGVPGFESLSLRHFSWARVRTTSRSHDSKSRLTYRI